MRSPIQFKRGLLALIVVAVAGCEATNPAIPQPVYRHGTDSFDGTFSASTGHISTDVCEKPMDEVAPGSVYLDALALKSDLGRMKYALRVHYFNASWIYIKPGMSLEIVADGREFWFSTVQGSLDDQDSDSEGQAAVKERATYLVTRADLVAIAGAKSLDLRVSGVNGSVERCVMPAQVANLDGFLRQTAKLKQ